MVTINKTILVLAITIFLFIIIKMILNHYKNKKPKKKQKLLTTEEINNIVFNSALFVAGLCSFYLAIFNELPFGEDLIMSRPVINISAAVLFIWFALKNILGGNKNG